MFSSRLAGYPNGREWAEKLMCPSWRAGVVVVVVVGLVVELASRVVDSTEKPGSLCLRPPDPPLNVT